MRGAKQALPGPGMDPVLFVESAIYQSTGALTSEDVLSCLVDVVVLRIKG